MRPVKCNEHNEIWEIENRKKCWIQTWKTFLFLGYKSVKNDVDVIPFEELKAYPVGKTKRVETVTSIHEGNKPNEVFYPDEPEGGHKTDRLYKMLYVCPCGTHDNDSWLNEIEAVGFNVVHTYVTDKYPWEDALDYFMEDLAKRNMYGCLQLPHDHIENFIEGLSKHENGILSSVEEPDAKAGRTSKEEQMRIYELANKVGLPVWGCLDWGLWEERVNLEAFDLIMTDSYPYSISDGSVPVPGSPASHSDDRTLPQWTFADKMFEKFKMMKRVLPANMPVIAIQQGFYVGNNPYPNLEEEWTIYNREMGLISWGAYPHGYGQGFPSVMDEERIKEQCYNLNKKVDKEWNKG